MDDSARDWLRLARSPRVGPATFRRLLGRFGSARAALDALPDLAARGGARRAYAPADPAAVDAELAAAEAAGARLVRFGSDAYPALLSEIHDPPPLLWALGDVAACAARPPARPVAVVGSRTATANGARFAEWLSRALAEAGYPIISGLARGVDAAAHRGALAAAAEGGGLAGAAVVAGGVDHVYPLENARLRDGLIAQGVVLSEMPMGLHPQARHFPRRNRIVSGLSAGVVVVEAAEGSGSLITATMALEQNREVMAAPGHPFDPRAAGGNGLIRQGAVLVRHADDVVAALEDGYRRAAAPEAHGRLLDPETRAPLEPAFAERLAAALGYEPTSVDALARALDAPPGAVSAAILELELAGRAETHPGDMVALAAAPERSER